MHSKKPAFSISNFPIPSFASFSKNDPIVVQYKREREMIQEAYQGKDFVTFTLELLTDAQWKEEKNF